jgi:hypothetical protein
MRVFMLVYLILNLFWFIWARLFPTCSLLSYHLHFRIVAR